MLEREKNLKEALFTFKFIMDKLNYKFVLGYGACLGAVRNQRLLPYDFDIDIFLPIGDCKQCTSIMDIDFWQIFVECGKQARSKEPGWDWFGKGHSPSEWKKISWKEYRKTDKDCYKRQMCLCSLRDVRIDLVPVGKDFSAGHNVGNYIINRNDLEQVELYGELFYVPTPPEAYLTSIYGQKWRDIFCPPNLWHKYAKEIKSGNIPEEISEFMRTFEWE